MESTIFENERYSVVFAERRDIGNEWNQVKWDTTHKQIQYHRLYLLTEGNARLYLHDRELELRPGNVYFVPAFSVKESMIEGVMNKYYIHFQASSPFFNLYRYLSDKYYYPTNEISEYLFKTVVENYSSNSMSSLLKVQGAMNLILSDFLKDVMANSSDLLKFEKVLKYIDEHYKENIPISTLASIMNISSMYFSNYFKMTFNISPKQYIINKRLMESQRLLLENQLSIKEIAYAVGFENENYFSEFFSSKVGISALKFRKRELPTTRESIL